MKRITRLRNYNSDLVMFLTDHPDWSPALTPRDDTPEVFGLFGPSGTFYPVDDVLLAVHTEIVYCHA